MNVNEFSNEFDILIRSHKVLKGYSIVSDSNNIEFNEYEKSIFLTNAQRDLILDLYNGTNNNGFESNEEVRRYLSQMNDTLELDIYDTSLVGISNYPTFFKLPSNTLVITIEQIKINNSKDCLDSNYIIVQPLSRDKYNYFMKNPFRKPDNDIAYRLDHSDNIIEIVYHKDILKYKVGILKAPTPIILEDLYSVHNDVTIEGYQEIMECKLPLILHREILNRAVRYALSTVINNNNNNN